MEAQRLALQKLELSADGRPPVWKKPLVGPLQLEYSRQYHYFGGAMEKSVSAADANRKFSKLMQGVRKGRSYLVFFYVLPVAQLVPAPHAAPTHLGPGRAPLA